MNKVIDTYNILSQYRKSFKKFIENDTIKSYKGIIHIRPKNKELVLKWLKDSERRLQNINGYDLEAKVRYYKTLYKQLNIFAKNILFWFNHIDLDKVNEKDIRLVYNGLEQNKITSISGKYLKNNSKKDYYSKVFRGKKSFFGFLGKDNLCKDVVLRQFNDPEEVRFFDFDTLQVIVNNTTLSSHRLAFWLLFDTGIEINALCQITKNNFILKDDKETKPYYIVHIGKEISKKKRQIRDIYIYFNETNDLLMNYLASLKDDERLFDFNPPALYKALKIIVHKHNLKVKPTNLPIQIKDFRSSMASYFLTSEGWTTDEVKNRLGHKPSSDVIDKYVSYHSLNTNKKRKEKQLLNFRNYEQKYREYEEKVRNLSQKIEDLEKDRETLMLIYNNSKIRALLEEVV